MVFAAQDPPSRLARSRRAKSLALPCASPGAKLAASSAPKACRSELQRATCARAVGCQEPGAGKGTGGGAMEAQTPRFGMAHAIPDPFPAPFWLQDCKNRRDPPHSASNMSIFQGVGTLEGYTSPTSSPYQTQTQLTLTKLMFQGAGRRGGCKRAWQN